MSRKTWSSTLFLAAAALILCVLSFYDPTNAAQPGPKQPFSNAVEQRANMLRELREIRALLKEQNELLRAAAKTRNHARNQR